ncbi:MAG: thioredoxin family protein [Bacteroidota bacterium]
MKNLIVIAFLMLSAGSLAQEESTVQLNWLTNLEEAQRISKAENKPILMYMTGSDWCAPCKMLKKDFFETEEFAKRAENLVLVMIDHPRAVDILTEEQFAYNKTIIAKYNKDKSFPKVLILNSKGKEQDMISGYGSMRDPSYHFAFVDKNSK